MDTLGRIPCGRIHAKAIPTKACIQGSTCLRRLSYTGPHSYKPFIREATFLQWQALPPILLQHLRQGRSGGSEMQKDALRQMLSDTDVEIIWTSRHRPLAIVRMLAAIVQVPLSRCPAPGPALRGGKWSHSSTMPCRLAAAALRKSALVLSLSLLLASEQALVCSGPLGRRCASAACICLHVTHRLHLTHGLMPLRCRTRTRNECCSGTARSLTQVGACLWCLSLVLVFGACRAFPLPLPARAVPSVRLPSVRTRASTPESTCVGGTGLGVLPHARAGMCAGANLTGLELNLIMGDIKANRANAEKCLEALTGICLLPYIMYASSVTVFCL